MILFHPIFLKGFAMIFRRTNDAPAAKTPTTATRREPEVTNRPTAITPTNNPAQQMTPLSPIAMAQQARRGGNAPSPANGFNRATEQLRKLTVGRDISLNGEITTCDHLIVEGNVTATIKGGQVLEIMETGTYSGLVDIEQADIAGVFDGELTVRGKLTLRPTATVTGMIHYGRLQVDAGAVLNGQLGALPPVAAETTAANTAETTATTPNPQTNRLASINDQPGFLKASA
jgi:cytoskeletal protein CcmA (bactofilin family)